MRWLVSFPQAREAPRHWMVGRVRPTTASTQIAARMLADAGSLSVRARDATSRRARVALALLGMQGFRPVAEYRTADLDSRVVRDFQVSQYHMRHTSDDALVRGWDAPDEARRAEAEAEMRDVGRARDASRTAFSSNFGRAVRSVTNDDVDIRSSARVRHVLPATG